MTGRNCSVRLQNLSDLNFEFRFGEVGVMRIPAAYVTIVPSNPGPCHCSHEPAPQAQPKELPFVSPSHSDLSENESLRSVEKSPRRDGPLIRGPNDPLGLQHDDSPLLIPKIEVKNEVEEIHESEELRPTSPVQFPEPPLPITTASASTAARVPTEIQLGSQPVKTRTATQRFAYSKIDVWSKKSKRQKISQRTPQVELTRQAKLEKQAELKRQAELEKQAELKRQFELKRQAELEKQAELTRVSSESSNAEPEEMELDHEPEVINQELEKVQSLKAPKCRWKIRGTAAPDIPVVRPLSRPMKKKSHCEKRGRPPNKSKRVVGPPKKTEPVVALWTLAPKEDLIIGQGDREGEWKVEEVRDVKIMGRVRMFKIKWYQWDEVFNTWETEECFSDGDSEHNALGEFLKIQSKGANQNNICSFKCSKEPSKDLLYF